MREGKPQVFPQKNPEREQLEIAEEIRDILEAHVVELSPSAAGRREHTKTFGDAALGVREAAVDRATPPLEVESAAITRGKSKVLIGPNGAGKSTFFDALMERSAHFSTREGKGAVVVGKPSHVREKLRVGRLDQEEILGKVGNATTKEILENAARYFKGQFTIDWEHVGQHEENLANQEVHTRIDTLMTKIGGLFEMDDFLERRVEELSGGERTKLALFMVLLSEPDVFLFDEPTNHLDLHSIAKLTALFDEYKRGGAAILSVSHVDWFLRDVGNDGVLEIEWNKNKRILRESKRPYGTYIQNPTREKTGVIQGEIEWLQKDYEYKRGELVINGPASLTVPKSPLRDIWFPSVTGGELIVMSGKNGTGKTKLLEALLAENRGSAAHGKKIQIAYLPQFWPEEIAEGTIDNFFDWLKVRVSPLSKGSAYHPEHPAKKFFITLARDLSFGGASHIGEAWLRRPLKQLSGGEQRLLWFIAVSALRDVDVLMLDEPTNHMDRQLQEKVMTAIRNFPGAVVLSTHDKNVLLALAEDGGLFRGAVRTPTHVTLEKKDGKTSVAKSSEKVDEYIGRILKEARQQAKRFTN